MMEEAGMQLVFEWDPDKARRNLQKHEVVFDEAVTVFDEPLAVVFTDQDHSADEEREIIVGYSLLNRLLWCHSPNVRRIE